MPHDRDRIGFVESRLVRHPPEREQRDVSRDLSTARTVVLAGDKIVLRAGAPATALLDAAESGGADGLDIFLGLLDGQSVFAVGTPEGTEDRYSEPDFLIQDLRAIAVQGLVAEHELGLLATAKSILSWHTRNGFCANCGAPTEPGAGGMRRECPRCAAHHFPRTDPVAIMLIRRGQSCLIGRGPHFPGTMYSCLAGFVEPGETIEAAVRRETFEETGIRVGDVRYHSSQPWPFPSSLMIGCIGEALDEAIVLDPVELADARWVSRDALRLMFEERHPDGITVPKPLAIAHWLLRAFLEE